MVGSYKQDGSIIKQKVEDAWPNLSLGVRRLIECVNKIVFNISYIVSIFLCCFVVCYEKSFSISCKDSIKDWLVFKRQQRI